MKMGKKLEMSETSMYLVSVKIRNVKKLQQDIEGDPIIKVQIANIGCLSVSCLLVIYLRLF